jgi:hypothetical protein
MRTSNLIDVLATDQRRPVKLGGAFLLALAVGVLVSVSLFLMMLGPRSNFIASLTSMRFDLKFVDSLALALPSALMAWRVLRPDARPGALAAFFLAPFLLLGGAVVAELMMVPSNLWGEKLVGSNSMHCLVVIPLLSIAPLAALLVVMREGAPQNPRIAGALAGAAAAGIAAMLYASNCPDDSPLFVATWYPLATLIVVGGGVVAGDRLLRW